MIVRRDLRKGAAPTERLKTIPAALTPAPPSGRVHTFSGENVAAQAEAAPMRVEMIQRIRREIRLGRYLAEEKLDLAADALFAALQRDKQSGIRHSA